MKILEENSNRDLFMGADNKLGVLTGIAATSQACKSTIEAQRGELQYNTARGIPTESTLWSGVPNQQRFQFYCIQALQAVEGVIEVRTFDTEILDNALSYSSTIVTDFGVLEIGDLFNAV